LQLVSILYISAIIDHLQIFSRIKYLHNRYINCVPTYCLICTLIFYVTSLQIVVDNHFLTICFIKCRYTFRCFPKSKDRHYLVSANDIAFSPLYVPYLCCIMRYKTRNLINHVLFSVSGVFVTGDNEGYVIMWDAGSKRRLVEVLPINVHNCL